MVENYSKKRSRLTYSNVRKSKLPSSFVRLSKSLMDAFVPNPQYLVSEPKPNFLP